MIHTRDFLRQWAFLGLLGSGVLWVCYAVSMLIGQSDGEVNHTGDLVCTDHLAFYTAARLTRFGPEDAVYDLRAVSVYQANLFRPCRWDALEAFRNPPFYALLYWPTCGGSYAASAWTWFAISLLCVVLGSRWVLSRPWFSPPLSKGGRVGDSLESGGASAGEDQIHPPRPPFPRGGEKQTLWLLAWVFSFYPTFCAFSFGQNTPLSYLIFAGTYRLLAAGRPFAAGLVAGLLWFKPQLLLGLGIWGLLDIRRKWPCALGAAFTGIVLTAGSYPVVPTAWHGFLQQFGENVEFANFEQFKMHNPLAFWRLLLPMAPQLHAPLAAFCSLAAIAAFAFLWWKRHDNLPVMFGGMIFLTLWANPHALLYEWTLLGLTGLLWLKEYAARPREWFVLYAVAWGTLFASSHLAEVTLWISPVAVQVSVPALAWVGGRAVRLLTRPATLKQVEKLR